MLTKWSATTLYQSGAGCIYLPPMHHHLVSSAAARTAFAYFDTKRITDLASMPQRPFGIRFLSRKETMALSPNDIMEIQQVQAMYSHAVDTDPSLLPRVFTKDAIFDGRRTSDLKAYFEGIDVICSVFAEGKPRNPKVHTSMNVWVYEEGGQVRVKSKWLIRKWMRRGPTDGMIYIGDYEDIMERTPDGWKIKQRVCIARDPGPVITAHSLVES
jgi:hypothetical protein